MDFFLNCWGKKKNCSWHGIRWMWYWGSKVLGRQALMLGDFTHWSLLKYWQNEKQPSHRVRQGKSEAIHHSTTAVIMSILMWKFPSCNSYLIVNRTCSAYFRCQKQSCRRSNSLYALEEWGGIFGKGQWKSQLFTQEMPALLMRDFLTIVNFTLSWKFFSWLQKHWFLVKLQLCRQRKLSLSVICEC